MKWIDERKEISARDYIKSYKSVNFYQNLELEYDDAGYFLLWADFMDSTDNKLFSVYGNKREEKWRVVVPWELFHPIFYTVLVVAETRPDDQVLEVIMDSPPARLYKVRRWIKNPFKTVIYEVWAIESGGEKRRIEVSYVEFLSR